MADKQILINTINQYALEKRPFLLIADFELNKPLLFPIDELPQDIRFQTPGFPGTSDMGTRHLIHEFERDLISYEKYQRSFRGIRKEALAGNTFLANLTFQTPIRTNLGIREIYELAEARYKLLMRNEFVVFSPEIFIRIRDGMIRSYPMKGTIDADIPGAKEILLEDEKEMAEHVTIVDLIRNDMSIHASHVRVNKFRYLDTLATSHKTLLQVSSEIEGQLPSNYLSQLGNIIFSMLPAGSVSGAPKHETLRIIREAEGADRGYYTGIMGYFDGSDFDSAVLIRYIENQDGQLVYRSGGGITFLSDPEKEYQETVNKAKALLKSIEIAEKGLL